MISTCVGRYIPPIQGDRRTVIVSAAVNADKEAEDDVWVLDDSDAIHRTSSATASASCMCLRAFFSCPRSQYT